LAGLGGDSFFVTAADSSTNKYREWAREYLPNDKLYTTIAAAEDACVSGRGDTVYVFPGTYTVSASLTWDKHNTNLVGLGGPLSRGGMGKGVYVNCATANVAQLIDVQGDNVQFYNINLRNAADDADNVAALKVSLGESFYAVGCHFVGQAGGSTQANADAACSLWLYTSSSGKPWGAYFKNCRIGSASEQALTGGQVILFSGSTALTAKYITFEDCTVESYSDTAGVCAVHIDANYSNDRYTLFKDTLFYNFSTNHTQALTEVIDDDSGTTHETILMGSTCAMGFSSWDNAGIGYTYAVRGADAAGYGLMEAASSG